MNWKTHMVVGANSVWIASLFENPNLFTVAVWICIGSFTALLPDIDAAAAKIHFVGGKFLQSFRGMFRHRGIFHSFGMIVVVSLISFLLTRNTGVSITATLGYASHPIIDGFNTTGVEYFFPWRKKIRLIPRAFSSKVNGPADQFLFVIGTIGLLVYLVTQLTFRS